MSHLVNTHPFEARNNEPYNKRIAYFSDIIVSASQVHDIFIERTDIAGGDSIYLKTSGFVFIKNGIPTTCAIFMN